MNRETIIVLAQETIFHLPNENCWDFALRTVEQMQHFAKLVADAERERIIAANPPEIKRVKAHIKALEGAAANRSME